MKLNAKYALVSFVLMMVITGALAFLALVNGYLRTENTLVLIFACLIMTGILTGVNALIYRLLITSRLKALNNSIVAVSSSTNFSFQMPDDSRDEFSPIAMNVNIILSKIANSQLSLRQSKKQYSDMVECSHEGIATIENDLITYVNPRICKITGLSRNLLLGKPFIDLVSSDYKEVFLNNLISTNSYKLVPNTNEVYITSADGDRVPVEITSKIVEMGTLMIVLRDISERKKLENQLKLQNELIQRVLENITDAVAVLDAEQRFVWLNAAFRRYFIDGDKKVEGMLIQQVVNLEKIPEIINGFLASSEIALQKEFQISKDGKVTIFILDIMNMQKEYLLVIRDITEIRTRQENLHLTDRLASVGQMASGIAHELNNPLTSIVGLTSLILRSELPEELKQDLQDVNSEAQRAAAIVKNLLTFARKHNSEKQVLNINNVIEDVLKLRVYEQKSHNIQVINEFSPDIPPVLADYFQMQQVFLNIMLNAESAMIESHGEGKIHIQTSRENGNVRIKFIDNGPGIAKENINRIFDPFFTTKEVGKGTGLGLSICYGIVKNHNGKIGCESEYGKGATFVVDLPVLN